MKNSNKPVWLRRMNFIALIVALLLVISAIAFAVSIFGGFTGVIIFDIFLVIVLFVIGAIFLIAFPPTLIGLAYEIIVIVLNIVHACKSANATRNNTYFNNGCNYNNNRKFCGFGNDRYYM